jgi:methionyl-tRNA formyltransferase
MQKKNPIIKKAVFIGETSLVKNCFFLFKKKTLNIKIKFFLISKLNIKGVKKITIKDLNKFKKIDYFFSIINSKIIDQEIIKKIKLGLNFHNALLPKYRGLNSSTFVILNKEKFHGGTWHKLEKGIDTGEIAFQRKFKIKHKHDSIFLDNISDYIGFKLFSENIFKIINNKINFKKNNYKKYRYFNAGYLIKKYNSGFVKNSDGLKKIIRIFKAFNVTKEKSNFLLSPKINIKGKNFKITDVILSKKKLNNEFLFKKLKNKFIYFKIKSISNSFQKI